MLAEQVRHLVLLVHLEHEATWSEQLAVQLCVWQVAVNGVEGAQPRVPQIARLEVLLFLTVMVEAHSVHLADPVRMGLRKIYFNVPPALRLMESITQMEVQRHVNSVVPDMPWIQLLCGVRL